MLVNLWFINCSQILQECKRLLLNIATPDAVMRLKYSPLASEFDTVSTDYFDLQSHSSLFDLLSNKLSVSESQGSALNEVLLLQITTHSNLLSELDIDKISEELNLAKMNVSFFCAFLQEFDTELDFCNKLRYGSFNQV